MKSLITLGCLAFYGIVTSLLPVQLGALPTFILVGFLFGLRSFLHQQYEDHRSILQRNFETYGRSPVSDFRSLCFNWIKRPFISALWIVIPLNCIAPAVETRIFDLACTLLLCLSFSGHPIRLLYTVLSPLLMIPSLFFLNNYISPIVTFGIIFFTVWLVMYIEFLIMWINLMRGRYVIDASTNLAFIVPAARPTSSH